MTQTGLDEALEDVRTGNVTHWSSVDEFIEYIKSIAR